jgi:hypothetical protein
MGAAYDIVVNSDDPGFDTSIDGKALSRNSAKIDVIATSLGFKSLNEYFSTSPEDARLEMAGMLGIEDENDLPPENEAAIKKMPPEEWYDAGHGADYAGKIAEHIRNDATTVAEPEAVLFDLESMSTVMAHCKERGLQWHLFVDY